MCYHCAVFLLSMSSMVPIDGSQLLGSIVDRFTFDLAVSSTLLSFAVYRGDEFGQYRLVKTRPIADVRKYLN